MELDFSDKIKQLFKAKGSQSPDSGFLSSTASSEAEKDKVKESEKSKAQMGEEEDKEEKCEDCGKPESECECEDEDEEESDAKKQTSEMKASEKILNYLSERCKAFNSYHESEISLDQAIIVFNRGLEEAEKNFKPGRTKAEWAFARLNSFFRMASNKESWKYPQISDSYAKADCDILNNKQILENYSFSDFKDIEFQLAKISCLEAGLKDSEMNISFAVKKKVNKTLNKPFRLPSGSNKKFGVYVKNDKGNTVMVKFGDPNMEIKRDDPERRKSYRARHNCDNPGPKWKANYWSCKMWSSKPVSKVTASECGCSCGNCEEKDIEDLVEVEGAKKGLWDNIREKKKRMGKNYKPAKPGDKDRPSKEAFEKAQAEDYDWDGEEQFNQEDLLKEDPSLASVEVIED